MSRPNCAALGASFVSPSGLRDEDHRRGSHIAAFAQEQSSRSASAECRKGRVAVVSWFVGADARFACEAVVIVSVACSLPLDRVQQGHGLRAYVRSGRQLGAELETRAAGKDGVVGDERDAPADRSGRDPEVGVVVALV